MFCCQCALIGQSVTHGALSAMSASYPARLLCTVYAPWTKHGCPAHTKCVHVYGALLRASAMSRQLHRWILFLTITRRARAYFRSCRNSLVRVAIVRLETKSSIVDVSSLAQNPSRHSQSPSGQRLSITSNNADHDDLVRHILLHEL